MTFLAAFVAVFLALWVLSFLSLPAWRGLLKRAAHWTAAFRYGDYLPVVIALAIGVGVTALSADGFLDLAELLSNKNPELDRVDGEMHARASALREPGATVFFTIVTHLGSPIGLAAIVALVCVPLVKARRWRWLAYLLVTSVVGSLLNLGLKAYYARARPDLSEAVRHASGYSFPSGHSMGTAIVFGALCYLGTRAAESPRAKAAVFALSCTMIVAVAASRVYLGVHWISDVAAGVGAGLMWVGVATVAYETSRRIRLVRALRKERARAIVSS